MSIHCDDSSRDRIKSDEVEFCSECNEVIRAGVRYFLAANGDNLCENCKPSKKGCA